MFIAIIFVIHLRLISIIDRQLSDNFSFFFPFHISHIFSISLKKNRFLHRTLSAHKIAFFPRRCLAFLSLSFYHLVKKKFEAMQKHSIGWCAVWVVEGGSEWNLKMEHRKWMQGRGKARGDERKVTGVGGRKVEFIFYFPKLFFCSSFSFFFAFAVARPKKIPTKKGREPIDVAVDFERCKKLRWKSDSSEIMFMMLSDQSRANADAAFFFLARKFSPWWNVASAVNRGMGGEKLCAFRARCLEGWSETKNREVIMRKCNVVGH